MNKLPSSTIVSGPSHCYRQGIPKQDRKGIKYDGNTPICVTMWFRNWVEACKFAEETHAKIQSGRVDGD